MPTQSSSASPLSSSLPLGDQQRRLRLSLPKPSPRDQVGRRRQRARDAFNVQELLFGDALAQRDFSDPLLDDLELHREESIASTAKSPMSWGTGSFASQKRDIQGLLRDVEGREWEDEELAWTLRLALRSNEGWAPLRPTYLRYALCARHGLRSLPIPELHVISVFELCPGRIDNRVDCTQLMELMEKLNEGIAVPETEVQSCIDEARLLGNGSIGRSELMKGLGSWYTNVQRQDSGPEVLLQAWASHLVRGREYHTALMDRLRLLLPVVVRGLRRQKNSLSTAPLSAAERSFSAPLRRSLALAWALARVLGLLGALTFPGLLFVWAIYMGSEHGSDACPHDLAGLLTWFGILGLAFLFVGCADAHSYRPSWSGFLLRTLLLVFPWAGLGWTFHLRWEEQKICGLNLVAASMVLWVSLLLLELFAACALCWGAAVFAEHELSLRHLHAQGWEDPADAEPCAT
eukprot:TRINITY_DN72571_c0_g1_i1.p1 TRINITY_DN72571_c0_g1~~TRINITY_DN72571_c0_g1_i1.p1  ORF type:complete len:462 (-),score=61.11 TRINITY_DN72571_c0_g1_i1:9-1394(-)